MEGEREREGVREVKYGFWVGVREKEEGGSGVVNRNRV